MLSQKKETKEKATPYRLFPEIALTLGRQAETRQKSHLAQTAAYRKPPKVSVISGAVAGDFKVKTKVKTARHSRENGNPLSFKTLNWIPAFAGMTV